MYPAYCWSAKDAWKCLGMFVVVEFVIGFLRFAVQARSPGFSHFVHSGAGHFTFACIFYGLDILIMLYFARVESFRDFKEAFGLASGPSPLVWFAVVFALVLRFAGHYLIVTGWAKGVTTTSLWGFAHSVGLERWLYLAPALMAPFGEELYMRGFFYRAFRGSYPIILSTGLILGVTALTHWEQVHRSGFAAVAIGALTIFQCFLRERTGNLWDCIICHLVFNATGAFTPYVLH